MVNGGLDAYMKQGRSLLPGISPNCFTYRTLNNPIVETKL